MSIPAPRCPRLAVTACLLAFGACASSTPAPRFTTVSPADQAAAESAVPAPPAILTSGGELAEDVMAAGSAPRATPATSVYTCPMHPEVAAKEPGKCPICGMALVTKAIAPKERP